eukprot:1676170-Rhodomonas_salina.1
MSQLGSDSTKVRGRIIRVGSYDKTLVKRVGWGDRGAWYYLYLARSSDTRVRSSTSIARTDLRTRYAHSVPSWRTSMCTRYKGPRETTAVLKMRYVSTHTHTQPLTILTRLALFLWHVLQVCVCVGGWVWMCVDVCGFVRMCTCMCTRVCMCACVVHGAVCTAFLSAARGSLSITWQHAPLSHVTGGLGPVLKGHRVRLVEHSQLRQRQLLQPRGLRHAAPTTHIITRASPVSACVLC